VPRPYRTVEPKQILLQRAHEPFGDAVALGFSDEGWQTPNAKEGDLIRLSAPPAKNASLHCARVPDVTRRDPTKSIEIFAAQEPENSLGLMLRSESLGLRLRLPGSSRPTASLGEAADKSLSFCLFMNHLMGSLPTPNSVSNNTHTRLSIKHARDSTWINTI
jgi:hypothetical protein